MKTCKTKFKCLSSHQVIYSLNQSDNDHFGRARKLLCFQYLLLTQHTPFTPSYHKHCNRRLSKTCEHCFRIVHQNVDILNFSPQCKLLATMNPTEKPPLVQESSIQEAHGRNLTPVNASAPL